MSGKISPWGASAFFLGAVGLLAVSVVGVRSLTIALAGAGVGMAGVGALLAWRAKTPSDKFWNFFGGALSGVVLCLTLFVPGVLNDFWALDVAVPQTDPNPLVLIPHKETRDPGKPMPEDAWADAVKEALRQDDLFIRLESVTAGQLPERGATTFLLINFRLSQIRPERTVVFEGLRKDKHTPVLKDDQGRSYAYFGHRPRRPFLTAFDITLNVDHLLIFELPPAGVDSLYLQVPAAAWGRKGSCRFHITGITRESSPDMAKAVAEYKKMLHMPPSQSPDLSEGRTLFAKNCQECHTLFGFGNKVGPDLTDRGLTPDGRQKRTDLDFLVTNIVDPSAEIAKGFEPFIIETTAGLVIHGIIKDPTPDTITVASQGKTVVLQRKDIEKTSPTKVSIMPKDLLKELSEHQVRSLFAYVSGPGQVPLLASPANSSIFFSGVNLNYWHTVPPDTWKVERGELIAPKAQAKPPLCVSELLMASDFHLSLQFHPGKTGGGAVRIIGESKQSPAAAGPRVAFTAGSPIVLTGSEAGRADAPEASAANNVQADAWNKLEIIRTGQRLQTRLNGKDVASLEDPLLPARVVIALEGPTAGDENIRFRYLDMRLEAKKRDGKEKE